MPAIVSYPGVYVIEEASGARAIAGVPTSIAAFIGMAERGRMTQPVRILSLADFEREYGPTTSGEMADQVRQFYLNGGGHAYVCRIADGALRAAVTLHSEGGASALVVTARDPGLEGNLIRVEIDYATANPERTFNMTLHRSRLQPDGSRKREAVETFSGLSMDPGSGAFIETAVNGVSSLVTVAASAPAGVGGVSIAGLVLPTADGDVRTALAGAVTAARRSIRISVANRPPVTVALGLVGAAATPANIGTSWTNDINQALTANGISATVTVEITDAPIANGGVDGGRLLRISSNDGPVVVTPASTGDVTATLMLGTAAGGLEGDRFGDLRPAPTGVVARNGTSVDAFAALRRFAAADRSGITGFTLVDDSPDSPPGHDAPIALGGPAPVFDDGGVQSFANVRLALEVVAAVIEANSNGRWTARRHGYRLALTPRYGNENTGPAAILTTGAPVDLGAANFPFAAGATPANVTVYTVGQPGGVAAAAPSRPRRCKGPMVVSRSLTITRRPSSPSSATSTCSISWCCRAPPGRTTTRAGPCGVWRAPSAPASAHS